MTQKLNFQAEMENNKDNAISMLYTGFVLIKKFHIALVLIMLIAQLMVNIGVGAFFINKVSDILTNHEGRLSNTEKDITIIKNKQVEEENSNVLMWNEIRVNMKSIMKERGLEYEEFKTPAIKK
jgi:hypothetical protein